MYAAAMKVRVDVNANYQDEIAQLLCGGATSIGCRLRIRRRRGPGRDSSTVLRSSDLSRDARPAAYRTGPRDTLRGMHIYEVLAQPIRRRIVEVLASGEHTAGNLEAVVMVEFGVTRAAAQHHLRVLREHDMAVAESDWPHRSYRLNDHFVSWLELEAQRLRWLWDRRIGWRVRAEQVAGFHHPSARGARGRPGTFADEEHKKRHRKRHAS